MSAVPVPYKYDAFIAHSSKDKRIVEEVLQQLEERGITCCYSRRDNVAGVDIISFMENAVVCSRKTIAFISKDFLESPYCKKERDLALLKAVKTGKDVLIPLILDDVAFENLPMALCGITCLEIGRKHFLSRLLKAMGGKLSVCLFIRDNISHVSQRRVVATATAADTQFARHAVRTQNWGKIK